MNIELRFTGDVVERSDLLNGTASVTLEGASTEEWTIVSALAWSVGLIEFDGEGDLTIARPDGAELFATAISVALDRSTDDEQIVLARYEIDGGSGALEHATGTVNARLALDESNFSGTWTVEASDYA